MPTTHPRVTTMHKPLTQAELAQHLRDHARVCDELSLAAEAEAREPGLSPATRRAREASAARFRGRSCAYDNAADMLAEVELLPMAGRVVCSNRMRTDTE